MSLLVAREVAGRRIEESAQMQDAVIRRLEIIGEAVKSLPTDWKDTHPEIEWRQLARLRDPLIHRYFSVDLDLTWTMARNDAPALAQLP